MQVFQIAPANLRTMAVLFPVLLIPLAIVLILFGASFIGMKSAQFEISNAGLRLRGDLYGRTIPIADLRGGSARRLDIDQTSEWQPTRRTLGTGLPGYRAGWFRLRNGEKALLYVTDPAKAVYVPTRLGYSVMVTPGNPDEFLNAIRTIAPAP